MELKEEGLLMLNRSPMKFNDLDTSNISDGIILYEKINTNPFFYQKIDQNLIKSYFYKYNF